MPRENVIVAGIRSLSPSIEARAARPGEGEQPTTVNFESGQTAILDMTRPRSIVWMEVLDSLRQANLPAYIEIDPDTRVITELLLPKVVNVQRLSTAAAGKDVEVELVISQARHFLRRANPDFRLLLDALRAAQADGSTVLVTETLAEHEIIDVRPAPKVPVAEAGPAPPLPAEAPTVTLLEVQNLFDAMNAQTCDPVTVPSTCIPFNYPYDGCYARAHEMCRQMLEAGAQPEKVWIYGNLDVRTSNSTSCNVSWIYHVAPTLQVDLGSSTETFVIDPSLFSDPVRLEQWKSVQGDLNAKLESSPSAVYYRPEVGDPLYDDDKYTTTNQDLLYYRNALKLIVAQYGPPPYSTCIPDVYLRDNLLDTGQEPLAVGGISASPDINHYRQELADPQGTLGTTNALGQDTLFEPIEFGQSNYIYLRLQNRGDAAVVSNVDVYYALPSTLPTPSGWSLIGSLATPPIVPGEFRVVGPLIWNNIPQKGHYCFVAVLDAAQDPKPDLTAVHTINDFYAMIREHNNVTWKNFDVYDMFAGGQQQFEFWIQGWPRIAYQSDLEIDLSQLPKGCTLQLRLLKRLTQGATLEGLTFSGEKGYLALFDFHPPGLAAVRNMSLKTSDRSQARLTLNLPKDTPNGAYQISVLQKVGGKEMGRVTKRLIVGEFPYVVNANSDEVHLANCVWVKRMNLSHRVAYRDLELARLHGYNGCRYCLPEFDTG